MSVRVDGPFGEHFVIDELACPSFETADHVYDTMSRVRDWDNAVKAGWVPLNGSGRMRHIPTDDDRSAREHTFTNGTRHFTLYRR